MATFAPPVNSYRITHDADIQFIPSSMKEGDYEYLVDTFIVAFGMQINEGKPALALIDLMEIAAQDERLKTGEQKLAWVLKAFNLILAKLFHQRMDVATMQVMMQESAPGFITNAKAFYKAPLYNIRTKAEYGNIDLPGLRDRFVKEEGERLLKLAQDEVPAKTIAHLVADISRITAVIPDISVEELRQVQAMIALDILEKIFPNRASNRLDMADFQALLPLVPSFLDGYS